MQRKMSGAVQGGATKCGKEELLEQKMRQMKKAEKHLHNNIQETKKRKK